MGYLKNMDNAKNNGANEMRNWQDMHEDTMVMSGHTAPTRSEKIAAKARLEQDQRDIEAKIQGRNGRDSRRFETQLTKIKNAINY